MSLVQHVSAVEGSDRIDISSLRDCGDNASFESGRALSLCLSYDPLPKPEPAANRPEAVGAYKVSTTKRIAQVVVGVIICLLASGIVFGFAALKQILIEEGVYQHLCTEHELKKNVRLCYLQDQRLNLNFIIGSVTTNLSALLVGAVLDRYGPFPCGIVSCIILFLGSLCMALEEWLPFDGYPLSFFLLALGGTFTFVPSFQLGNAFPAFQGLIISLITGAFDASAAVFLAFRLIFESTDGAFGTRQLFLVYLVVPVLILIANLTLMPRHSYETRAELENDMEQACDNTLDIHDSDDDLESLAEVYSVRSKRAAERAKSASQITDLIGDEVQQIKHEIKEDEKKMASGVWGVLHGLPASKQMRTPWFILIAMFTVLQMSRFNVFISTIWSQYHYLLGSSKAATAVTKFFDTALPIGGVVTMPFIGFLLDNTSTVAVLALLVLLSTVIGVLGAIPTTAAAYANVLLFVIFRPLYYSAMSDYAAKVFGFATFGTVYGAMICLSGLSLFLQPALQALVHGVFENDPSPVNLGLAGAGLLVGIALVMFVDARSREIRQRQFQFLASNPSGSFIAPNGSIMGESERRSLLSVSLYDSAMGYGGGGGSGGSGTPRRRLDFRSPRLKAQDLLRGISPTSSGGLGASMLYNYGSIRSSSPVSAAATTTTNDDQATTATTATTITPATTPSPQQHPRRRRSKARSSLRLSVQSNGLDTVSEHEELAGEYTEDDDDEEDANPAGRGFSAEPQQQQQQEQQLDNHSVSSFSEDEGEEEEDNHITATATEHQQQQQPLLLPLPLPLLHPQDTMTTMTTTTMTTTMTMTTTTGGKKPEQSKKFRTREQR